VYARSGLAFTVAVAVPTTGTKSLDTVMHSQPLPPAYSLLSGAKSREIDDRCRLGSHGAVGWRHVTVTLAGALGPVPVLPTTV